MFFFICNTNSYSLNQFFKSPISDEFHNLPPPIQELDGLVMLRLFFKAFNLTLYFRVQKPAAPC